MSVKIVRFRFVCFDINKERQGKRKKEKAERKKERKKGVRDRERGGGSGKCSRLARRFHLEDHPQLFKVSFFYFSTSNVQRRRYEACRNLNQSQPNQTDPIQPPPDRFSSTQSSTIATSLKEIDTAIDSRIQRSCCCLPKSFARYFADSTNQPILKFQVSMPRSHSWI